MEIHMENFQLLSIARSTQTDKFPTKQKKNKPSKMAFRLFIYLLSFNESGNACEINRK